MGVGYAGLKDRHAVTTQRFSVHLPKRIAPDIAALDDAQMQVIDSTWHNRKLQRGALHGNGFVLTLRQVHGERDAVEERLQAIAARGIPNWFGEQRFGRDGGNVAAALVMFGYVQAADGTLAPAPTSRRRLRNDQRSMLLSAARSALFNRVLTARVEQDSWDSALEGEAWMLDGSRSVFGPERGAMRWQSGWRVSISTPAARCGARARCARPIRRQQWSRAPCPIRNPKRCARVWKQRD